MRRTDWLMCVKWRAKRRGPNERPPGVERQCRGVAEEDGEGSSGWRVEGWGLRISGWSEAPWWGKASIESDRDKWSARDREKEIQTWACWPQPFSPPTNQYGEMLCGVCVTVRSCECARACLEGEALVCVALNKDQKAQRHYLGPSGLPTPSHASI